VRILGIDCGSHLTGYGVIETGSPRHLLVEAGVVRPIRRMRFRSGC